jgi:hypothetical protein
VLAQAAIIMPTTAGVTTPAEHRITALMTAQHHKKPAGHKGCGHPERWPRGGLQMARRGARRTVGRVIEAVLRTGCGRLRSRTLPRSSAWGSDRGTTAVRNR